MPGLELQGEEGDPEPRILRLETRGERPHETTARVIDGGRIHRAADLLEGRFMATYADGVADIDLAGLRSFHVDRGALATMTVGSGG